MVGERDREQQDAARWEELDDAAISIPPPFNLTYNGALHHNRFLHHQQQQQYAAMLTTDDMHGHWDDEQMALMADTLAGCQMPAAEKGVRFPTSSPTHVGYNNNNNNSSSHNNNNNNNNNSGQLSQAPLQRAHSRYE
jgi:hypothetical protein